MDKIIERIREKAKEEISHNGDDPMCSIYDLCGGNYDDAYYVGRDDGAIYFARELSNLLDKQ